MDVKNILIAEIDATKRKRPVDEGVADQMADSIQVRGIRQPIEVTKQAEGKPYRLITGGHRLAACVQLEIETIPAIVITGTELQLRADELLENLERSELSALERAEFYAELKLLYQESNPDAKHGGDRTKEQEAKLADWYETIINRSGDSKTTIKRAVRIGQKLTTKAKDELRGTSFEHNQAELEALAKQEPKQQVKIARALTDDDDNRPKTVAQAVKIIEGHVSPAAASPEDTQLSKLLDAWTRCQNPKARRQFIAHLVEQGEIDASTIKGAK